MYEVRWTYTDGDKGCKPWRNSNIAWGFYESCVGEEIIDSVGLYYTDGDGNEKELAVWCRK